MWLVFATVLIYTGFCYSQDSDKDTSSISFTVEKKIIRVTPEERTDSSGSATPRFRNNLEVSLSPSGKNSSENLIPKYIFKSHKEKAVSGETGYNSLVGTGIIYHYFVEEHISIEAGFGGSSDGFTPGIRGRMEFGTNPIPYWGAFGLSYSFGSFFHVPLLDRETRKWPRIKSLPVPRVHLQLGTQLKLSDEHFVLAYFGYSLVLTSETWKPHPDDENLVSVEGAEFFDSFFGSGLSLGLAFGIYPF